MNNYKALSAVTLCAALILILNPDLAQATVSTADILEGSNNPIQRFMNFLTGGFAIALALIGIITFGVMVMFGNEFSGLARRIPLLILGLALILGAAGVVSRISDSDGMIIELETPQILDTAAKP